MNPHVSFGTRLRTIMRSLVAVALVAPLVALASDDEKRVSEADAARVAEALAGWLAADCEHVSVQTLMRYRDLPIADIAAALGKGPLFDSRERVRQAAEQTYRELVEQAGRRPERRVASSGEAYVQRELDNFDARYRVRAAQVLAAIDSPEARRALQGALGEIDREEVRKTIQAILAAKPR
jgi:hypothetical protein